MKEFYKFSIAPDFDGLSLWLHRYYSFHETPCYHYCVEEFSKNRVGDCFIVNGESMTKSLERRGVKVYRIHKTHSRKAFDTKEKAYENFMYLKKLQLGHIEKNISVLKKLIEFNENNSFSDLKDVGHAMMLPNTKDFINNIFTFD